MKTFKVTRMIERSLHIVSLLALCGIVSGQDRPRNFFQKDRDPSTTVSASASPAMVVKAIASQVKTPLKSPVKSQPKTERPRNFFQRERERERAAIEPTPIGQPADASEPAVPFNPVPEPDPEFQDGDGVPVQVRPPVNPRNPQHRPTLMTLLATSVQFRRDVPRELEQSPPTPSVILDGYGFPGCIHCPAAKDRFETPYKGMAIRWHEVEPKAEVEYPYVIDQQVNMRWYGQILADWPTLYKRVNLRRSELGLPLATMTADDSPIYLGSVQRDLFSIALELGNTPGVELMNQARDFTDKAWAVSVPENLFVKWATTKNVRFECPKNRATIKTAGWNPLEFSKPIKAIELDQKSRRIYLETSFWRKFYIEVKE